MPVTRLINLEIGTDQTPPPPPPSAPNAPTNIATSNVAQTSVTISWTAATLPPGATAVQGYRIYDAADDVVPLKSVGLVTSTSVTGLSGGVTYEFYVAAFNSVGESIDSTHVTFTTSLPAAVPNPPTSLNFSAVGDTTATLTWTAATLPAGASAVTGYKVYRVSVATPLKTVGVVTTTGLTGLTSSTSYSVYVTAINATGESGASNTVTFTTTGIIVPNAPTNFAVTSGSITQTAATVTWTAATVPAGGTAVTGYNIYRTSNLTTPFKSVAVVTTTGLTGLTLGTNYTFLIKAINSDGESVASNTVSFTTTGNTTGAPFLPYTSNAYFYSGPADYGPANATDTAAMLNFLANDPNSVKQGPYPILNGNGGNQWGMVFREANPGDPVWHLNAILAGDVPNEVAFLRVGGSGFNAPADLKTSITGTSDSPMVIRDRVNGISVWASKCSAGTGNVINVGSSLGGAAGAFFHSSNGLDQRRPESNDNRNFRSRGAIPDCMVVTKARMDWARANNTDLGHVIHMFWSDTDGSGVPKFPMVGSEPRGGWGHEGQRIAIKPTVDIEARTGTGYAKVLGRTLQRHGFYIGDNAGSTGAVIKLEQDQPAHMVWGSTINVNELKGLITWQDFQCYNSPG